MQPLKLSNVMLDIKTILSNNSAPIRRVGVFGSLVRGKIHENSDIDIAIEYESGDNYENYTYDSVIEFCEFCDILEYEMSVLYGRKIDVIPVEERKGCLLDDIREEVVWI